MYKVSIPEISKEELERRYQHIKPIVEIDGVKYFLREFTTEELSRISYIWGADQNKREIVDMSMYSPYSKDFECIHKYAFYGFFKPSIAEVLAQIPENQVNFMDAFEIISYPETAGDFTKNSIVFKNGFHVSIVRLYTKLK